METTTKNDANEFFDMSCRTIQNEDFLDEEDFLIFANRIISENEELNKKLATYSKDYKEMGDIVVKLQGDNEELLKAIYIYTEMTDQLLPAITESDAATISLFNKMIKTKYPKP